MTREELYNSICPYLVDCENTNCDSCNEILNRLFDKYEKQIRAEAFDECIQVIDDVNWIESEHYINLLKQLKMQNKSKNLRF